MDMSCQLTLYTGQPRIAVVGMGYVGAVSAAALASRGFEVTGVEVNLLKLDMLKKGDCPERHQLKR